MSTVILLNTTIIQTGAGPKVCKASNSYDTSAQATDIAYIKAAGGIFVPSAGAMAAQAVIAQKEIARGRNEFEVTDVMIAAAGMTIDPLSTPQVVETATVAETAILSLAGAGTVVGAYYLPNAASAPASPPATNNMVLLLNIYNAAGTLVGQLASGTLSSSNAMTKWARFSLGAITNGLFSDGYMVTATITLTGTATLPAGSWVVTTVPNTP
jgi:hypothetical protein